MFCKWLKKAAVTGLQGFRASGPYLRTVGSTFEVVGRTSLPEGPSQWRRIGFILVRWLHCDDKCFAHVTWNGVALLAMLAGVPLSQGCLQNL